jgi:hypothetical protein
MKNGREDDLFGEDLMLNAYNGKHRNLLHANYFYQRHGVQFMDLRSGRNRNAAFRFIKTETY